MTRNFFNRRAFAVATSAVCVLAVIGLAAVGWRNHAARAEDKPRVGDSFPVPDGTPEELLQFIEKTQKAQPVVPPETPEEVHRFVRNTRRAIIEAADKILATQPEGKIRESAIESKALALLQLDNFAHDSRTTKPLFDYLNEIKQDSDPEVVRIANETAMMGRVHSLMRGDASLDDAKKLWAESKAKLTAAPDDLETIHTAMMIAQSLDSEKYATVAIPACRLLADMLSKSKDPDLAKQASTFAGMVLRLSLPGHPIEITGALVDGTPFNPAALKGKVVLIDFWATWCGPCVAELPNVKANYEKYHAKGFEVVGVSLDDKKTTLERFIAHENIPWPILFNDPQTPADGKPSMTDRYGIYKIPTVILTNQQGDVISLDARGPELGKKLEELLGK